MIKVLISPRQYKNSENYFSIASTYDRLFSKNNNVDFFGSTESRTQFNAFKFSNLVLVPDDKTQPTQE